MKGVGETVENEVKEHKLGFLAALAVTLATSLVSSMFAGNGVISEGERTIRACQNF